MINEKMQMTDSGAAGTATTVTLQAEAKKVFGYMFGGEEFKDIDFSSAFVSENKPGAVLIRAGALAFDAKTIFKMEAIHGDKNALVFPVNHERVILLFEMKTERFNEILEHKSIDAYKEYLPIRLVGQLDFELTRMGLQAGSVVFAKVYFTGNKAAHFTIDWNGVKCNCEVWPENYQITEAVKA